MLISQDRFRRLRWLLFLVLAIASAIVVAIPTLYIMPFRPQTARGVELSYTLRRLGPMVTAVGGAAVVVLAATLWRRARWWSKGAIVVVLAATGLLTWFTRQNHFEWMFNPLPKPAYVEAAAARGFLTGNEIVMGIEANGLSLAYPIRQMAYHHLVNDMVGTTPVVVTY